MLIHTHKRKCSHSQTHTKTFTPYTHTHSLRTYQVLKQYTHDYQPDEVRKSHSLFKLSKYLGWKMYKTAMQCDDKKNITTTIHSYSYVYATWKLFILCLCLMLMFMFMLICIKNFLSQPPHCTNE